MCAEKFRKGRKANKKEMRRTSEVHKEGQDISMATKRGVLQVDRSPEPNRERQTLVKNDLNTTLSHRRGT